MNVPPRYVWQPSTPEIAARAGISPGDVVRADQNTSPFVPPWATEVSGRAAARVNDYPAAEYRDLRRAIADHTGADADTIVPGAGADELIVLAARAFLSPGDVAVADDPTYTMYRIATMQAGARYVPVARPLPDASFPVRRLAAEAERAALTWLCIPHNPIGDSPAGSDVDRVIAASAGVTVVDAAYAEFAGDRWGSGVASNPDVIVLGTLSKAFGLAGARVGYAIASPERAAVLDRFRPPGSIAAVSVELAIRSLMERSWMEEHVARTIELRDAVTAGLQSMGLSPLPSATNFVLCPIGPHARSVAAALMDRGIVVRSFPGGHSLADHLRFTVRTPDQQDRMLAALDREVR